MMNKLSMVAGAAALMQGAFAEELVPHGPLAAFPYENIIQVDAAVNQKADACHPVGEEGPIIYNATFPPCLSSRNIQTQCAIPLKAYNTEEEQVKDWEAERECLCGGSFFSDQGEGCTECKVVYGHAHRDNMEVYRVIYQQLAGLRYCKSTKPMTGNFESYFSSVYSGAQGHLNWSKPTGEPLQSFSIPIEDYYQVAKQGPGPLPGSAPVAQNASITDSASTAAASSAAAPVGTASEAAPANGTAPAAPAVSSSEAAPAISSSAAAPANISLAIVPANASSAAAAAAAPDSSSSAPAAPAEKGSVELTPEYSYVKAAINTLPATNSSKFVNSSSEPIEMYVKTTTVPVVDIDGDKRTVRYVTKQPEFLTVEQALKIGLSLSISIQIDLSGCPCAEKLIPADRKVVKTEASEECWPAVSQAIGYSSPPCTHCGPEPAGQRGSQPQVQQPQVQQQQGTAEQGTAEQQTAAVLIATASKGAYGSEIAAQAAVALQGAFAAVATSFTSVGASGEQVDAHTAAVAVLSAVNGENGVQAAHHVAAEVQIFRGAQADAYGASVSTTAGHFAGASAPGAKGSLGQQPSAGAQDPVESSEVEEEEGDYC